ncbi:MAG TPA: protein kinase [Pyrinomonadaceae bacterium]|nr:protein kinase [Pyrinomonadaceae bacterium]
MPREPPPDSALSFPARKRIGRYEICSQLGAGGMGEVYLANDTKLDRKVALKILPSDVVDEQSDERVRRFIQEAKAVSALNHPNILTIYEIDQIDARHFIATEFIDGETLRARIKKGPLTATEALEVGIQVAGALSSTHDVGIIHRDIKPDNIMLRHDGIVKVLDFGLAKLSRERQLETDSLAPTQNMINTAYGMVLGTAHYMSPEQARGMELDARTDVWSLGCVLYEMISGRQPFAGPTTIDVMSGILHREPDSLLSHLAEGPRDLDRVVMRAMRKERDERYQTAKDFMLDLKDLKRQIETQAIRVSTTSRSSGASFSTDAVPEKSIAVLYFENMNSEKESDYFCAGMTEDIITDLSKIKELKVVSRTDVLPFRNKEVNTRQVGDALRVNYILEGSVRKAGNRIRITAQLISVRDGYHLWAERFDRMVEDIFDLQNEVSQKIVDALKVSLTESERELLTHKPTDDLRAYDFYMRGRELLYIKGKRNTESAIKMFEDAIAIDPEFASAYAGLAEAYSTMYEWYDGASSWLSKAIEMNRKALELEPASVDAKFGIANVYFNQRRFPESKRAIEELLKENGEYYPGHLRLGMMAELSSDLESARKHYRRAAELKPYDEDAWIFLAGAYRKLGNNAAADKAEIKVIEITSRKLEASLDDIIVMSRLAEAYARFGSREEATATLKRVLELEPNDGLAVYNCSCAYALMGEKNLSLILLRRAFDSGFRTVGHWARTDSAFDPIRDDEEFQKLLTELQ